MTVAELIAALSKFNPDEVVNIIDTDLKVTLGVHPEDQAVLDRARAERPDMADEDADGCVTIFVN